MPTTSWLQWEAWRIPSTAVAVRLFSEERRLLLVQLMWSVCGARPYPSVSGFVQHVQSVTLATVMATPRIGDTSKGTRRWSAAFITRSGHFRLAFWEALER